MGATYLIGYTEKEQQQQQNRIEREREGERDRRRGVSTETEREVAGFIHAKGRGYAQTRYLTDLAGRVAGLRHLENTGMSYKVPEAQVKLKTQLYPQHRSAPENS